MDPSARITRPGRGHARQFQSLIGVNPLQTTELERGIVSGRVALLLRSAEIQPPFLRFVTLLVLDWSRVGRSRQGFLRTSAETSNNKIGHISGRVYYCWWQTVIVSSTRPLLLIG